ncbi:MAG: hypothetical protein JNL01_11020 [Bdellovibrionales bacterium]|nr:hypothetical protein [Bdellovibrionales bacterium]
MASSIRVGVLGSQGKMGKKLVEFLRTSAPEGWVLSAEISRNENPAPLFECDLVIEFSSPDAVISTLRQATTAGNKSTAWVIASTGWKLDQRRELEEYAKKAWIVAGSNLSLSVIAFQTILKTAAPLMQSLGMLPVIVESHHNQKKDAPSGTAITLQRIVSPSGPGNVQTHSIRAGKIVGEHVVRFIGQNEEIVLSHRAEDRSIFASGAIRFGQWLLKEKQQKGEPAGLISVEKIGYNELL